LYVFIINIIAAVNGTDSPIHAYSCNWMAFGFHAVQ